jgi:hypothetical protein
MRQRPEAALALIDGLTVIEAWAVLEDQLGWSERSAQRHLKTLQVQEMIFLLNEGRSKRVRLAPLGEATLAKPVGGKVRWRKGGDEILKTTGGKPETLLRQHEERKRFLPLDDGDSAVSEFGKSNLYPCPRCGLQHRTHNSGESRQIVKACIQQHYAEKVAAAKGRGYQGGAGVPSPIPTPRTAADKLNT